jgi:hypothetical protein
VKIGYLQGLISSDLKSFAGTILFWILRHILCPVPCAV